MTLRHDTTAEQIVDALAMNRVYEKAVVAINKIDIATEEQIQHAESMLPNDWPIMRISAFKEQGLEELKDFIYDNLDSCASSSNHRAVKPTSRNRSS